MAKSIGSTDGEVEHYQKLGKPVIVTVVDTDKNFKATIEGPSGAATAPGARDGLIWDFKDVKTGRVHSLGAHQVELYFASEVIDELVGEMIGFEGEAKQSFRQSIIEDVIKAGYNQKTAAKFVDDREKKIRKDRKRQ